jgi:diacylglycerol O-acyltransferase / wax synthase
LRQELHVPRGVAWSEPLPLDALMAVGRGLDATLNDVLVSCIAGALGRHLRARDALVDELHALVPFNLRPLDKPLPRELGNKFGLILLGLPVGLDDPVERVLEVKRRMDDIKRSKEGPVGYGVLAALGVTPAQIEARFIDFFTARGTLVLTNVPGPREVVSVAGSPVRGALVWAPCAGSIGMTAAIFSYRGEVTVGLMADRGLLPEPGDVVAEFGRELRETAAAVDIDGVELSSFPWDSLRRRPDA